MSTADECLAQLEAVIGSGDQNAAVTAEIHIEELLQSGPDNPRQAATLLGDLQAEFARRMEPSPARSDILDLLGSHILRLLEADSGEA